MRPSLPVRHLTVRRNAFGVPRRGALGTVCPCEDLHVLDTEVGELLVDLGFAVAAVGGDRARCTSGALVIPFTVGASCGASGGLPCSTL